MSDVVIDIKASARRMRAAGHSLPKIGRWLASQGVYPPRGGKAWQAVQVQRYLESDADGGKAPPAPPPAPVAQPVAPPLEYPLATVEVQQHVPGTVDWYESELRSLQLLMEAARKRTDRVDAQGVAALQRQIILIAERLVDLRAKAAANSSAGLTLEQRLGRQAEAARKAPMRIVEIWVLEWCTRHRVDMDALRQARLVRAEEET